MSRPADIDQHLNDLERFFTEDNSGDPTPIEWQFGNGTDFNAQHAVDMLRQYVLHLEAKAEGVSVPEWVIIQSCRYGFGRRSYALETTCDHLRSVWSQLSEDTRSIILDDLAGAIQTADRFDFKHGDKYGLRVLRSLHEDLEAKGECEPLPPALQGKT